MILWLNGPYGVGKSTVAETLHTMLTDSMIFDAEQVGNAIRDNMPENLFRETFEEYPLWADVCVQMLQTLSVAYPGHVLVPMTIRLNDSMIIFSRLRDAGTDIRHIMLTTTEEEILRRILLRGEGAECWCAQQVRPTLVRQEEMLCDFRLDAALSPSKLARLIAISCGLECKGSD